MRFTAWLRWVALAAAPLLLFGCLELTGQRVTMRYDSGADKLYVLLQYDGVHNNKERDQRGEEKKLRKFVEDGDVMLFDWFGHFKREKIREAGVDADEPPAVRAFANALVENAEVVNLGHYRDPDGRLGAAQLLILHRASLLVTSGNAAINAAIRAHDGSTDDGWWDRTLATWKELAVAEHQWVAIDGHSLTYRFPVEPMEWARAKLEVMVDIAKDDKKDEPYPNFGQKFLSSLLVSLEQSRDEVAVRVGDADVPSPLRVQWRETYQPNMEELLTELVPTALDDALSAHLLDRAPLEEHLQHVVAWGPAEERVRAVLGVARKEYDARHPRARAWLEAFAARWNEAGQFPEAPAKFETKAWERWYRKLVAAPEV